MSSLFWSKYFQEDIWFINCMALGDILGWSSSNWYFPTHDKLIWICLLASIKLCHSFIPCVLTHVSRKFSPKLVGHVIIFQIWLFTCYMIYWVHVVFDMRQGRNWPFLLRLSLGLLHCMSKLLGGINYSILSEKWSSGYAYDSSYARHITIILDNSPAASCLSIK